MQSADIVIVGGGVIGSAVAYFAASDPDFRGRIVVVEKDPTYAEAATRALGRRHPPAVLDGREHPHVAVRRRIRQDRRPSI